MSGLAAVFFNNKTPKNSKLINDLIEPIKHRGTDGIEIREFRNASIAYLKTINLPESKWEKPYEDEQYYVVSDARIDDREGLCLRLGIPFDAKITPTEYIAFAFKKWGGKLIENIIGDFAFVVYDKEKDEIFFGRDHMGIKPLFYFLNQSSHLAISSDISSIQNLPGFSSELDEEFINLYLAETSELIVGRTEISIFKKIKRVAPSSIYKFRPDLSFEKYENWKTPAYDSEFFFEKEPTLDQIGEEFLRLLNLSLIDRNRSDYIISSDFSGGLDSSTIAILSSKINQNPLITFNNVTNDARFDEGKYIETLIKEYNVNHYWVQNNSSFRDSIFENIYLNDPCFSNGPISWFHSEKLNIMRAHNSRTYLTGHDGDTLVSHGYDYFDFLLKEKRFKDLKQAAIDFNTVIRYEHELVEKEKISLKLKTKKFLYHRFYTKEIKVLLRKRNFRDALLLTKNFFLINGISLKDIFKDLVKLILGKKGLTNKTYKLIQEQPFESGLSEQENYHLNILRSLNIQIFNGTLSSYFAQNQIDVLFPFYDKRLIDFCIKVPLEVKFNKGLGRGTIRAAIKGVIPDKIIKRTTKTEGGSYMREKMGAEINFLLKDYNIKYRKLSSYTKNLVLTPEEFEKKFLEFQSSASILHGLGKILRRNIFLVNWLNKRIF